jgi:2-polyprenyl-6-methoxyphenol hydroxylase-like FAD-dependent oxidoreductase
MTNHDHTEVLIVGAGPTGLVLAGQLARLGVSFRVIDKSPHPSTTSKAIGLQYRVSEVLDWMGLTDQFRTRGVTLTAGVSCYVKGAKLLTLRPGRLNARVGRDAFVPRALIIPQSETEAILGESLCERGGRVEWGTGFVDFNHVPGAVVSRLRRADGTETVVRSKYLVSCEGAHSLIRKQARFSFEGKTYPMKFFMADVELDWHYGRDEVHAWMHPDGVLAAMAMPGHNRWRLMIDSGKAVGGGPAEVTLQLVQEILAARTGERDARAVNPTWLTEFKINCRMVDRFRNRRVFLAGDAAHIHSPSGGQGIVTGVQDAYNLAWKLGAVLRDGAPDRLLDTYGEERLPVAREVLRATDRNTNVFFATTTLTRLLRDHVILPVLRLPPMQERLVREMSQLDKNYRASSLSEHQDRRLFKVGVRVRAGDRTPDVVFEDPATGCRTSLFRLLGRCGLLALVGPGRRADGRTSRIVESLARLGVDAFAVTPAAGVPLPDGMPCLADVHGDFRRLYGARGEFVYLIRPDGHVGLFQCPINEDALKTYLARLRPAAEIDLAFSRIGDRERAKDVALSR